MFRQLVSEMFWFNQNKCAWPHVGALLKCGQIMFTYYAVWARWINEVSFNLTFTLLLRSTCNTLLKGISQVEQHMAIWVGMFPKRNTKLAKFGKKSTYILLYSVNRNDTVLSKSATIWCSKTWKNIKLFVKVHIFWKGHKDMVKYSSWFVVW